MKTLFLNNKKLIEVINIANIEKIDCGKENNDLWVGIYFVSGNYLSIFKAHTNDEAIAFLLLLHGALLDNNVYSIRINNLRELHCDYINSPFDDSQQSKYEAYEFERD